MWATITMLVAGCEKKPEAVQTQNTAAKTEEVKPKVQANQLTEKEIQDLESLENHLVKKRLVLQAIISAIWK